MDLTITTDDGQELVLAELYRWLADDAAVVRSSRLKMTSTAELGRMGALDVINVVIVDTTGLLTLALAYASWRQGRRHTSNITFTRGDLSVTVRDASAGSIQQIIDVLSATDPKGVAK